MIWLNDTVMNTHPFLRNVALLPVVLIAGILLVAACAGPPGNNPLLNQSRAAYTAAAADPQVVSKAPDILKQAQEELARGERSLRDGAPTAEVEHYAYLVTQRVAIARETVSLKLAEETIAEAEGVRNEVQLQARTAEAEAARDEADASRLEAEARTRDAVASRNLAEQRADEAQRANQQTEQALAQARVLAERIAQLEAEQTARGLVLTLGDVLFDVGKSDLKPGSQRAIDQLASFLNEYAARNVLIEGFTDNTGSTESNQNLSSDRAAAVKAALMARGIGDSRVRTTGYGETFPRATNDTAEGRQQNRRVEVIISDESGSIPTRTN